ncbi:LamG domain-containing protein [Streptomyces echinatus]|uniref:LamG domain-containing protein n=1 Tax=Streptomyces echinatus TaxID=67293 RepID=UPI0037A8C7D6
MTAATATETANTEPGDPAQPGEGDASAVLPVTVENGSIAIQPDLQLLRGADTVYPVYIDPPVGLGAQERTKISSDGDKFWMFDGDKGVGKCGNADGYYCGGGYIDRMYFEFAPTALSGKHVLDATFRAHETWSFNCDAHTVDLKRTNNISEATSWPGPSQLDHLGDRSVAAGRGSLCSPDQPDAWIEFNDNAGETDENLTSTVRSFANGSFSRLTLMLRAHDETEPRAWKRFDDNAELQVIYAYKPGVPTNVGVIPGTGTTAASCEASADPVVVTLDKPTIQARAQTQVSSGTSALLQTEFALERRGTDNVWRQIWTGASPDAGWDADNDVERMQTMQLADGYMYRLKARTQSHWTYNTVPGDLWSSYSSWCYFKTDSAAPKAPRITSVAPYTLCSTVCEGKGGPGLPGTFVFEPNTADISNNTTDITAYEWKLLSSPTKTVPRGSALATTVKDVIPPLAGTQVLSVRAKDVYNRWGTPQEFIFKVAPAEGAVGRWQLDGVPGSGTVTATDTAEVGTRHNATLTGSGTGWSSRARRGENDYALRLNDYTTNPTQTGYAATTGLVVNTRDSFTVSAWVQLTDASANRVVLSAPGTNGSAFALYYSSALKKWVFNRTDKDVASPAYVRSVADQESPQLNVWTHVAGVFKTEGDDNLPDTDPSNDTIQLFINGRPQGQPVVLSQTAGSYTPWTASGGLQFGRFLSAGAWSSYHVGLLDEVAVWQRFLTPEQLVEEAKVLQDGVPANELVADWDATTAAGTQIPERSSYPVPPMTVSGTTISGDDKALVLDGTASYASAAGPVVDETGSFTVAASVRLDSAALADKPAGYRAQVAGQRLGGESSWALWIDKVAEGVYLWEFTRTSVGSDGKVTQSAIVSDDSPVPAEDFDNFVTVTGIFDAQESWESTADDGSTTMRYGKLHLFVREAPRLDGENAGFASPQQGSGELSLGRGTAAGSTGNYLPGGLESLRIWTGAMTADQVSSQILAPAGT